MPATLEVKCTNDECELDMFELHYTYDMPDETGVSDFQCPYCSRTESLREIEL
jgi:aspartate carbamoyltransferase regulatory subunit